MSSELDTSNPQHLGGKRPWSNTMGRAAWIKHQLLHRSGLSIRKLAAKIGVTHSAVAATVNGTPNSHIEPEIAKHCGCVETWLFPEHYSANGERIRRVLPRQRTAPDATGKVKKARAA